MTIHNIHMHLSPGLFAYFTENNVPDTDHVYDRVCV